MKPHLLKTILILPGFILLTVSLTVFSQAPRQKSSSEILMDIKKLNVLGNVLYIAAHPDDENTRLIGYLANERLFNTAYLSMTRGDGGQNLVGPEISELLGIIRTQELLAARRTDGSEQFFTRANDFGYSKSADETLQIWDREKILSDIIWVIRNFQPDVIITRFPPDERAGHGQHESSTILAEEAFDLAKEINAFPEQLRYTSVWQPARLLWNTGRFWSQNVNDSDPGVISINTGEYNPYLGKSYPEIAATSRSMHKSQGFGSSGLRGEAIEYLISKKGSAANEDLMDGIDYSWNRVKGGLRIKARVDKAISSYNVSNPSESVPQLLEIRRELLKLEDAFWRERKIKEINDLIKHCMGLYLEMKSQEPMLTHGDSLKIGVEAINRSQIEAVFSEIHIPSIGISAKVNKSMNYNNRIEEQLSAIIPTTLATTQPYWLIENGTLGVYRVDDQQLVGKPENNPAIVGEFTVSIAGENMKFSTPVIYKWTDPVKGELYRPLSITPPAFVEIEQKVLMFPNDKPKDVQVRVKSARETIRGELILQVPDGWKVSPASRIVEINSKGEEKVYDFIILPPKDQQIAEVKPIINIDDGTSSNKKLITIEYDHLPTQILFPESSSKIVRVEIERMGDRVGYIMGAGDEIPESLEQIGYSVWKMMDDEVTPENLKQLDAVILGVRVLNTNDRIRFQMPALLGYVKNGGTLVVQYNTTGRLKTNEFSPYPLRISRDRVAEENAQVEILLPDHPALTTPNKISQSDFEGWVQERGLYFPNEWSEEYDALLSSHDQGEDPKNGGLLVAKYGEGYYVYSGYAWFRELPAGVPGAYRLFTNLISLGQKEKPRETKVGRNQK
ncbi:MAG TPA: PIG-L family deacetylase [Cyclobacteriaceae bacterium]|jgi:LmbE family N-acetylglucosaminyl deacetylase